jgi:hypothetical protein
VKRFDHLVIHDEAMKIRMLHTKTGTAGITDDSRRDSALGYSGEVLIIVINHCSFYY